MLSFLLGIHIFYFQVAIFLIIIRKSRLSEKLLVCSDMENYKLLVLGSSAWFGGVQNRKNYETENEMLDVFAQIGKALYFDVCDIALSMFSKMIPSSFFFSFFFYYGGLLFFIETLHQRSLVFHGWRLLHLCDNQVRLVVYVILV